MSLTAKMLVLVLVKLLAVILVLLAFISPPVVLISVAVMFKSLLAVISPELLSVLARIVLLLACSVPALVIRLLAVLLILPLLFRCFLMLKSLPATMLPPVWLLSSLVARLRLVTAWMMPWLVVLVAFMFNIPWLFWVKSAFKPAIICD